MKILATVLLSACLGGCSLASALVQRLAITQAKFSLDHVALLHADVPLLTPNAGASFQIFLDVDNPNPVAIQLDAMDYTVSLGGVQVGTGALNQDFSVASQQTGTLSVPLTVSYQGLPDAVVQAIVARQALVDFRATSHISSPIGTLDIPLDLSQTLSF